MQDQKKDVFRDVKDSLYSRVGRSAFREAEKRFFSSSKTSPRHSPARLAPVKVAPERQPQSSPRRVRAHRRRKFLGQSFCSVSREQREETFADHTRRPCVGQYSPNYESVTRFVMVSRKGWDRNGFHPFVRRGKVEYTLDGRPALGCCSSPKRRSGLCQRAM